MLTPTFRLFESVCNELADAQSVVITRDDFVVDGPNAPLMDELDLECRRSDDDGALNDAVDSLSKHFASKGASLPFSYDSTTGRFTSLDAQYIDFVDMMRNIRSNPNKSSEFEQQATERLALRTTGVIHRVGWKRTKYQQAAKFNQYLQEHVGFTRNVLLGKEKDGGLDILWAPPLGSFPHRPLVSVQCKNGEYDREVADGSLGTSKASLDRQDGLFPDVHIYCVLFNDYITPEILPEKRVGFVPLGISDLAAPSKAIETHVL
jgi:hypothetical protein